MRFVQVIFKLSLVLIGFCAVSMMMCEGAAHNERKTAPLPISEADSKPNRCSMSVLEGLLSPLVKVFKQNRFGKPTLMGRELSDDAPKHAGKLMSCATKRKNDDADDDAGDNIVIVLGTEHVEETDNNRQQPIRSLRPSGLEPVLEKPLDISHFYDIQTIVKRHQKRAEQYFRQRSQNMEWTQKQQQQPRKPAVQESSGHDHGMNSIKELQDVVVRHRHRDITRHPHNHAHVHPIPPPKKPVPSMNPYMEALDSITSKKQSSQDFSSDVDTDEQIRRLREFIDQQRQEISNLKQTLLLPEE